MGEQSFLRGFVVIRRNDEYTVGADPLGREGEVRRVAGVVCTNTGDNSGSVSNRVEHTRQQRSLLVVARGGCFPRSAIDDEPVAPRVDEVGG